MYSEDAYALVKKAFQANEFFELLTGEKGYKIHMLDVPVEIPTDWSLVIPAIHEFTKEENVEKIKDAFGNVITRLIDHEDVSRALIAAAYILFNEYRYEQRNKNSFIIDTSFYDKLRKKIKTNKEKLKNMYVPNRNVTIYEQIQRLNEVSSKYGLSFL
jgi:intergrase/recombinase